MSRAALLALVMALPAASAAEEPGRLPLRAETLWGIKRLGAPAVSPDGRWAALSVTTWDVKEDKPLADLWLVRTDGSESRVLTTHEGSETGPSWSPDGRWIAFEAKREGDENAQIYLLPLEGGEAHRLTRVPTGASAPKWFPDSRRVAFISRVWPELATWDKQAQRQKERNQSKMTALTFDQAEIRYWDHWLDDRQAHLYSIGLEGGEPRPITLETGLELSRSEAGAFSYDISPDGEEVAFAADSDKTRIDSNFDVYVVSAGGGQARNLTPENPAADTAPVYSPDGRFIAFDRQVIKGFSGDRARLVLHDRATKANRVLTEGWDRSVGALAWTRDSKALVGSIDDAGYGRIHRIDAATGQPTRLTKAMSFWGLTLSQNGSTLVALRAGFSEPPTLVRVDLAGGEPTKLSTFNDELLARVDWGRYESVTYEGSGGQRIQMWVIYPPGFDRARRYPLYLLLHGGPHSGADDFFTFTWNAQIFAGWGYVTAWPNFHGSSGFGQAFADSINPDWATKPYEDTLAAAEWFARQPFIDRERMAAGGGSYGGYLASLLLGRPHPFKALVAHAAIYDLYTQYAADYGAKKKRFGEFWDPKQDVLYRKMSPHFGAPNFKTPTLVIAGGLDYRVPDSHGIELFNTLQNRGVRSRLVYYPNENHWIQKPQDSIYWYEAVQRWLEDTIGSGPR